jgi:hypothetical protein
MMLLVILLVMLALLVAMDQSGGAGIWGDSKSTPSAAAQT